MRKRSSLITSVMGGFSGPNPSRRSEGVEDYQQRRYGSMSHLGRRQALRVLAAWRSFPRRSSPARLRRLDVREPRRLRGPAHRNLDRLVDAILIGSLCGSRINIPVWKFSERARVESVQVVVFGSCTGSPFGAQTARSSP